MRKFKGNFWHKTCRFSTFSAFRISSSMVRDSKMQLYSMHRLKFFVLLFGVLLGFVSLRSPLTASPTSAESLQSGAAIYAAHCATCHGSDGRARTAKGKRTGATDFTGDWNTDEARGVRIITNGKSEMPSFKRKLKANEIKTVFGYVLRFRR
jgi:mono/diheme cytochrome c family protein